MRTVLFFTLAFLVGNPSWAQDFEGEEPPRFEVLSWFGNGLVTGPRAETISGSLSPTPQSINDLAFGAEARGYFAENWGFDVSGAVGLTLANHSHLSPVLVLERSSVSLGPRARWTYPLGYAAAVSVHGGLGINQGWSTYSSQYEALFYPNYRLFKVMPGLGYYAKVGAQFTPGRPFFVGLDLVYEHLGARLDESNKDYAAELFQARFFVGMGF